MDIKAIVDSESDELQDCCVEAQEYICDLKREVKALTKCHNIRQATVKIKESKLKKVMGKDRVSTASFQLN